MYSSLVFLEGYQSLTKKFVLSASAILADTSQQRQTKLTSHEVNVQSIEEFHKELINHARKGHCLFTGVLEHPLVQESRAGKAKRNPIVGFLFLDIDYLPDEFDSIENFMTFLGITNDYIYHPSASNLLKGKRSYHVYMLSQPVMHTHKSLLVEHFNYKWYDSLSQTKDLGLAEFGLELKLPIDQASVRPASLMFIAPPIIDPAVFNHLTNDRKAILGWTSSHTPPVNLQDAFYIVKGDSTHFNPAAFPVKPRQDKIKILNATRKRHGLKPFVGRAALNRKPDPATVTGIQEDRDWVRLNLNGGDSWGWYHSKNKPKYLYSYVTEEYYLLEHIVPEYWNTLQKEEEHKINTLRENRIVLGGYCEGQLFQAIYNTKLDNFEQFNLVKNKTILSDFFSSYGEVMPEVLAQYKIIYKPNLNLVLDRDNFVINTYKGPELEPIISDTIPPTILSIITNALGAQDNQDLFNHFINFLGCIVKYKIKTGTAYLLWGIPGTGKSLVVDKIIHPLIGKSNYHVMNTARELESGFNAQLKNKLILAIEETYAKSYEDQEKIYNLLKTIITEDQISIRGLYKEHEVCSNYINLVLTSNKAHALHIESGDRRLTVGKFQTAKLTHIDNIIPKIEYELPYFFGYLLNKDWNILEANNPFYTTDKEDLIDRSTPPTQLAIRKIISGDYIFLEQALSNEDDASSLFDSTKNYIAVLTRIKETKPTSLSKDELYTLVSFFNAKLSNTRNFKDLFTSMGIEWVTQMAHSHLDNKRTAGIRIPVEWRFK